MGACRTGRCATRRRAPIFISARAGLRACRRRLGWPIVAICVAMAACMAAGKLDPAWSLPERWTATLGAAMLLLMAALYGWTLLGLRRVRA